MTLVTLMVTHQSELMTLAVVAMMMAMSPGADFALVTRNSIGISRSAGLQTSMGITLGIWVHVIYCISGLALVINTSPALFNIIKYGGALYLIYLGISSLSLKDKSVSEQETDIHDKPSFKYIMVGFMSNALNPKTTLFFLGIYSQLVTLDTPFILQLLYGGIISVAHLCWFFSLSYLLSHEKFINIFQKYQVIVIRALGIALIAFGARIVFY
mgnify:CR=1 FL=1